MCPGQHWAAEAAQRARGSIAPSARVGPLCKMFANPSGFRAELVARAAKPLRTGQLLIFVSVLCGARSLSPPPPSPSISFSLPPSSAVFLSFSLSTSYIETLRLLLFVIFVVVIVGLFVC